MNYPFNLHFVLNFHCISDQTNAALVLRDFSKKTLKILSTPNSNAVVYMQKYITFANSQILFVKPDMLCRFYKQQYLKVTPGQSVQQHSLWKV